MSVALWGTGIRGGGESVSSGRRTVRVAPACFYRQFMTGQEYAAAWASGGNFRELVRRLPPEDVFEPWPGYLEHADDAEGHWYYPTCESDRFPSSEAYQTGYRAFRAEHDVVYVQVSDPVPVAQVIPPESLAQIAFEETDLPEGALQWNPRLAGSGATLVGAETWVWVDNPTVQVEVTAEIPGLSATVTSSFAAMDLEADGAEDVTCLGTPGTAWTQGATSECVLVFIRSSADPDVTDRLPTVTLTATARWQASWTSSAAPGVQVEMEDPQTIAYTDEIAVAEIQTLVTT